MNLQALAQEAAAHYSLDPPLIAAIIAQESSWYPWATRHEPAFFVRYIQPLLNRGEIKTMTEAINRATSWGLMQVMGQTARAHGFRGRSLAELCDPATGLDMGCRVFRSYLDEKAGDVKAALLRYNGGGNEAYPLEVLARIPLEAP